MKNTKKDNNITEKNDKRSQSKHPNLKKNLNLKRRHDLLDQDYLHKLNEEQLEWIDNFNREYVSGSLDRENLENNLHKDRKYIKDADDRNNARNRCVLTQKKAAKQITSFHDLNEEEHSLDEYENDLINEIDKKDVREAIEWLADAIDKDEEKLEKSLLNEQKEEEP